MTVTDQNFFSICRHEDNGDVLLFDDGATLDRAMTLAHACRMASDFSDLTRGEVYEFDPDSRTVRLVVVMATAPAPAFS